MRHGFIEFIDGYLHPSFRGMLLLSGGHQRLNLPYARMQRLIRCGRQCRHDDRDRIVWLSYTTITTNDNNNCEYSIDTDHFRVADEEMQGDECIDDDTMVGDREVTISSLSSKREAAPNARMKLATHNDAAHHSMEEEEEERERALVLLPTASPISSLSSSSLSPPQAEKKMKFQFADRGMLDVMLFVLFQSFEQYVCRAEGGGERSLYVEETSSVDLREDL